MYFGLIYNKMIKINEEVKYIYEFIRVLKMEKSKKYLEKVYIVIAILLTLFILGKVIIDSNICGTNDGYLHLIKIMGVNEIIKQGQFPPIIDAGFCNGYAINLFYNPLTTYISLICGLIVNNFALGIKIMLIIMMFLAIIFMYMFLKNVTKKTGVAIAGAIFYITNPYYLSNIFIRGAIGESAALTFLPLLFLGLYNLFNGDRKKHYFITIAATGLILAHNITTLYAAIISGIYVLINFRKLKEKDVLIKILTNILFIIGMSLFFIYPLILHRFSGEYVIFDSDLMRTNGARVASSVITFKELFTEIPSQSVIFRLNIIQVVLFVLSIFCYRFIDKKDRKIYLSFIIFAILSVILCMTKNIWKIAPDILCNIQFPWRLLGFSGFFISTIAGINLFIILKKIFKNKENGLIFIIIPIALLSLLYAYSLDYKDYTVKKDDNESIEFINNNINNINYMNINREYMPSKTYKALSQNPERVDGESIFIIKGDANIESANKNELVYNITLIDIKENTSIEVPFLFYKGYNAYIENDKNGKRDIDVKESDYGFLKIDIPKEYENGMIKVEYKTPSSYYVVYIISFITLIGFVIYIVLSNVKIKNKKEIEKVEK